MISSPDGMWAYVADTLDDTISVVEIAGGLRARDDPLGPAARADAGRPRRAAVLTVPSCLTTAG